MEVLDQCFIREKWSQKGLQMLKGREMIITGLETRGFDVEVLL
jgi:hypothetical protein